jgi:hypothetical protein
MNAFEQGYKDFGKGSTTNPYTRDTPKHRDWEFGFNKAYFRNLERVRENENRRRGQTVYRKEAA